jgi:uncharacterized membrane protein
MDKDLSVAEILKLRKPIRNSYAVHKEKSSAAEKFAVWISVHVGSLGFFILILVWTLFWLSWNIIGPIESRFDPYPAFQTWVFVANVIQLSLMPLILIGQNIQSKATEIKENEEYELNVRQERELEAILLILEKQNKILEQLNKKNT